MQQFVIPFRLPGLNEVIDRNRRNRYAGARLKRETQQRVMWCIIAAKLKPMDKPCVVRMRFCEPNRRRDVDNVESAKKFILDALVKTGVLRGDSPKWVRAAPSFTDYSKNGAAVIVEIREVGEDADGAPSQDA